MQPSSSPTPGRLALMLATRNGARFLDAQLRSVAEQDWADIDIWASDDASTDGTAEILARWSKSWPKGRFCIDKGPDAGFAPNFRHLLADPQVEGDYFGFCDQDDIWLPEKTRVAVEVLRRSGERPALYCARTMVVDEQGKEMYPSPLFTKPPHFTNALVQNIGGGNTMVMNRAAHRLLREAARRADFVSHDWFAYMMVTGAGGDVTYSAIPHVLYRQHDGNAVGSNMGLRARLIRLRMAMEGRFVGWNDIHIRALRACADLLTPESRATLELFAKARTGNLSQRLGNLKRSGVFRQTRAGQISLFAACVLGKL